MSPATLPCWGEHLRKTMKPKHNMHYTHIIKGIAMLLVMTFNDIDVHIFFLQIWIKIRSTLSRFFPKRGVSLSELWPNQGTNNTLINHPPFPHPDNDF